MATLRYSARSQTDLLEIWEFISVDSPRNADAVIGRLHDKIEQLRLQPLVGHRHTGLQRNVRCINSDGYLVFYRFMGGIVRIDRIVHHSRHLPGINLDEVP